MHDAGEQPHGCNFWGRGKEGRHRGRRAFVDIRCPHMERRGADLESKARRNESKTEQQPDRRFALCGLNDAGEKCGACKAVNQRCAVKQKAGRQRTEDEVFQPGFRRFHAVPAECGDHVERQRLQLQSHIERDQVCG